MQTHLKVEPEIVSYLEDNTSPVDRVHAAQTVLSDERFILKTPSHHLIQLIAVTFTWVNSSYDIESE